MSKRPPGSPLSLHPTGQWYRKIRGKFHYFGRDHAEAVRQYRAIANALHAGRPVARPARGGATVDTLCNLFLDARHDRVDSGELAAGTWADYRGACSAIIASLGRDTLVADLGPDDFRLLRRDLSKRLGKRALGRNVRMIRTVFKWGWSENVIEHAVKMGDGFTAPSVRDASTRSLWTPDEIRALLVHADGPMLAFVLLGINCGFGQRDCADLPGRDAWPAVIRFDRPKTAIIRESALWGWTREAIAAVAHRDGLAFRTSHGNAWVREKVTRNAAGIAKVTQIDSLGLQFRKLCDAARVKRRGFYAFRRTFRTVADGAGDPHATLRMMGHKFPGMTDVYLSHIHPDRLVAVAAHVRRWLFG